MENNDVNGAEKRRDARGTSPACSPMFGRAQKWHIIVAEALVIITFSHRQIRDDPYHCFSIGALD